MILQFKMKKSQTAATARKTKYLAFDTVLEVYTTVSRDLDDKDICIVSRDVYNYLLKEVKKNEFARATSYIV